MALMGLHAFMTQHVIDQLVAHAKNFIADLEINQN